MRPYPTVIAVDLKMIDPAAGATPVVSAVPVDDGPHLGGAFVVPAAVSGFLLGSTVQISTPGDGVIIVPVKRVAALILHVAAALDHCVNLVITDALKTPAAGLGADGFPGNRGKIGDIVPFHRTVVVRWVVVDTALTGVTR